MAEKLIKYFKYVQDLQGFSGAIKLATTTKLSSITAASAPDSPENIAAFKKAIQDITGKTAPDY